MPAKEKVRLTNISPRAWEHPADRAALTALRQIPQIDAVVKSFVGLTTEKSLRLISLASAVRAGERQFPRVHRLLQDACYVLDWPEKPEIFVSQSPLLNAGAFGVDKPFLTINSALVSQLADGELLAVIAHELAHVMSGHVLYKTLLWFLLNVSQMALQVPITGLALQGIIAALREWDRKSELSADRASLLALQDEQQVYTLLMKMAGGSEGEMSLEEFFVQAAEYEEGGNVIDSVHKLLNILGQNHPFPVLRLKELKTWASSGSYEKILSGDYRVRQAVDDPKADFEEARRTYQEDMRSSKDPLTETISRIAKSVDDVSKQAGQQADQLFRMIFGGKQGGAGE